LFRVMVVTAQTDFGQFVAEHLENEPGLLYVGCETPEQAIETARKANPDVVIFDIDHGNPDGIDIIGEFRGELPAIIVVSETGDDVVVYRANTLGAHYYLVKPFPPELLIRRIWQIAALARGTDSSHAAAEQIVNLAVQYFERIGMPSHLKGYHYLIEAMVLVVQDHTLASQVTKELYPRIAERFQTTAIRVERAIRNAIEITWERGNITQLNELFSYVDEERGKPTNSAFIAGMADIINLDLSQR